MEFSQQKKSLNQQTFQRDYNREQNRAMLNSDSLFSSPNYEREFFSNVYNQINATDDPRELSSDSAVSSNDDVTSISSSSSASTTATIARKNSHIMEEFRPHVRTRRQTINAKVRLFMKKLSIHKKKY